MNHHDEFSAEQVEDLEVDGPEAEEVKGGTKLEFPKLGRDRGAPSAGGTAAKWELSELDA